MRNKTAESTVTAALDAAAEPGGRARFPIVGVGASAGGLEAFTQLLRGLPLDTGMGFILVQHLDPEHDSALTQILSRSTSLPIHEVTNNQTVEANHVYVIPPGTNLTIAAGALILQPRPRGRTPHRPIDTFFESLAQDQRECAIGVVLSGTASDGTLGLEAIKAEGGITFAQDDSAKHHSMPRSAVAAGCVDLVLAPREIAKELARIAKHPYGAGQPLQSRMRAEEDRIEASEREDDEARPSDGRTRRTGANRARAKGSSRAEAGTASMAANRAEEGYKKILLLLRNHTGVDFSLYKSSTIRRRVARRLVLNKQKTLEDYAHFVRGNTKELDALYSDVLISVTSFFRNPETFDVLSREVLPKLLKKRSGDSLRCWVLGCSTGQEAYSIAMTFVEVAEKATSTRKLQIFATDLNNTLLDKARHGLYAKSLVADISPRRLRRFFVDEHGSYRISKMLRDMVVFARQDLVADPPFSRMDLISCRNLLIYLEPALQKKALPTFHYAIKPDGFLLLGASESVGSFTDLFEAVDKKHKIYSRKPASTTASHLPIKSTRGSEGPSGRAAFPERRSARPELPERWRDELNAQREADRITANQFAPPSVVVNDELKILQFRGQTGAYLQPPAGKASLDVLKMACEGLMLPLRAAINQARKHGKSARKQNVRIRQKGMNRSVNLEVIPLKNLREGGFLIVFTEAQEPGRAAGRAPPSKAVEVSSLSARQQSTRAAELEADLAETRDYLQSIQEQHDAANEELQAANEEAQSANEELQSVNEELETSKEELESANEELTTLNEEVSNRNIELNRLNNDLVNLQTSAKLAVVLVGRDLTIRRFSPQAEKLFDLLGTDLGRPISQIRHSLIFASDAGEESLLRLEDLSAEVIASVREQEREVRDKAGRWRSLRVRPYMTLDNRVDGAVLVLTDIDTLKRSEQEIKAKEEALQLTHARYRALFDLGPVAVYSCDATGVIQDFNRRAAELWGREPASGDTDERFCGSFKMFRPDGSFMPHAQWPMAEVVSGKITEVRDGEVHIERPDGSRVTVVVNIRQLKNERGEVTGAVNCFYDITERKQAEEQLRESAIKLSDSDRRKSEFLAMLAHELRNPLAPISHGLQIMRLTAGDAQAVNSVTDLMERQVGHLVGLVNDLLDVNRISRGKIELRRARVELAPVVTDAVEIVRPVYDLMGHELTVTMPREPICLNADPLRLAQVLGNLLNNACKFSEKGARIHLSVEREGEQAVVRVRDNGIGIAADHLPQIFDMFMQADASIERSASGLGIGLALVKTLVEMHGGTVEAHSGGVGQGSEFVVRLPITVRASRPQPAIPPVEESATGAALRILVVDDNRDAAASLAMLLKLTGNETHTAHDGLEAVETAAQVRPDLILLDIGLPKMNGYEAARRIREQPWGKSLVLVALTGWGQDEDRQKSLDSGFDGHLVKPVNPDALTQLLAGVPSVD